MPETNTAGAPNHSRIRPASGQARLLACPDCDLLQHLPTLASGARARCVRCGRLLAAASAGVIERPLALSITALILLILANVSPMMSISVVGQQSSTTILGGAAAMWTQGQPVTAVVVAFCAAIAPAAYIACVLAVSIAMLRPPAPAWVGTLLRWSDSIAPWSMIEVMMLGVLVALVKIAELARVEPGIGMYALGALMLLFPAIAVALDPAALWARIDWAQRRAGSGLREPEAGG
jgi:paraquat-inducible protein A